MDTMATIVRGAGTVTIVLGDIMEAIILVITMSVVARPIVQPLSAVTGATAMAAMPVISVGIKIRPAALDSLRQVLARLVAEVDARSAAVAARQASAAVAASVAEAASAAEDAVAAVEVVPLAHANAPRISGYIFTNHITRKHNEKDHIICFVGCHVYNRLCSANGQPRQLCCRPVGH